MKRNDEICEAGLEDETFTEKSGIHAQWHDAVSLHAVEPVTYDDEDRSNTAKIIPITRPIPPVEDEIVARYPVGFGPDRDGVAKEHRPALSPSAVPTWDIPVIGIDSSSRIVASATQRKRALDEQRRAIECTKERMARLHAEMNCKIADLHVEYTGIMGEYHQQRAELIKKINALEFFLESIEDPSGNGYEGR
jgi:hypothetical protein